MQNACKAHLKRMQTSPSSATGKRPAGGGAAAQDPAKRIKYSDSDGFLLGPTDLTPQQLEASLALPLETDEERIAGTAIQTNRAPLVLAFAVELIRYTMPEQPPSSRLSLAQAVVSANSRSKAVSIGLEKGPSADEQGFGEGQPRIRVMGREIAVLKRGGYEWKGEEEEKLQDTGSEGPTAPESTSSTLQAGDSPPSQQKAPPTSPPNTWSTSSSVSLKQSTFVARATTITDPSQRPKILKSLFDTHPHLRTATHNVWAYRIRPYESSTATSSTSTRMREASHDDGETGAGDLLQRILREANAVDTLVVLTRWYGGVMLGPDRWRLMRNVATSALSERLRRTGFEARLGGEAVWGLDLEAMKKGANAPTAVAVGGSAGGGLVIHTPKAARGYLLRSFADAPEGEGKEEEAGAGATSGGGAKRKKTTVRAQGAQKEENLGLLLGALRLLFDSWADHLAPDELDRRAWSWYSAVRPDVEHGAAGWGAKGVLRLRDILNLRRKTD